MYSCSNISPLSYSCVTSRNLWPPKYNTQRDPIPEIARECVEKLFMAIDNDIDGYVSYNELLEFVKKVKIDTFPPAMVDKVYHEITQRRGIVHKEQFEAPLTFDEIYHCCIV